MQQTPREIAEERMKEADLIAKLGERLAELKLFKAQWWKDERNKHKSDTSAERAFDLIEQGEDMIMITAKMQAKKYKISALRTLLDVANSEKFNQY